MRKGDSNRGLLRWGGRYINRKKKGDEISRARNLAWLFFVGERIGKPRKKQKERNRPTEMGGEVLLYFDSEISIPVSRGG